MQVQETAARRLLTNMGYPNEDWPAKKLLRRLKSLNEFVEQAKELEETDDANLRDEILEAIMQNEEIDLDEEDHTSNGHGAAAPKKKGKGRKGAKEPRGEESKKRGPRGPQVYDHSPAQVARWMGYNGFSLAEAEEALKGLGVTIKESTLRTYLTDGKREDQKYGKRAELKPAQRKELLTYHKSKK